MINLIFCILLLTFDGTKIIECTQSGSKVEIPENTTSIETMFAKSNSNISSIKFLGKKVKELKHCIFMNCYELKEINLENCVEITCIPIKCFYCCIKLKSIIIPPNVISIMCKAFHSCISLENITYMNINSILISKP